jgi:RNA polymerase sigma factor (sigma-70 family)
MERSAVSKRKSRKLWENFKKGDPVALTTIYEKYYPVLLDYGIKFKNNEEFVKDSIQEVFIYIMTHHNTLADTQNLEMYLLTCLRRRMLRKLKYNVPLNCDSRFLLNTSQLVDDTAEKDVLSQGSKQSKKALLKQMTDNLPVRQKEALLMKFYLHLDYDDIAQLMNINTQSARNLVYKAIKFLRGEVNRNHF